MSRSYHPLDDEGFEIGVLTYVFLSLILMFTLMGVFFEWYRRRMRNYIDQGMFLIFNIEKSLKTPF